MARDFDEFPVYDPLIKKDKLIMSDLWMSCMASFYQSLIGYLSQNGIFIPKLTTVQRTAIQAPVNGQMIYNTDLNEVEVFVNGVWVPSFSTNGIFVPQLTTTQRNAIPNIVNGLIIYNTTTNKFQGYENGAWANLI